MRGSEGDSRTAIWEIHQATVPGFLSSPLAGGYTRSLGEEEGAMTYRTEDFVRAPCMIAAIYASNFTEGRRC